MFWSAAHLMRYCISRSFSIQAPQWMIILYGDKFRGNSVPLVKIIFFDPAWQLDGADIIALAVMCAAFAYEDFISVFKAVECCNALNGSLQITFIACKQDRKRGQKNICRRFSSNFFKDLTVGDNQFGSFT